MVITNFFKTVNKEDTGESSKRKKRVIQTSDSEQDDDFVQPPTKKKAKEVAPSQYFADKKKAEKKTTGKTIETKGKQKDEDVEMAEPTPAPPSGPTAATPSTTKTPAKRKARTMTKKKATQKDDDDFIVPVEDDEDVDLKKEEVEKKPSKAASYFAMLHRKGPTALGTRPKPVGKPGCLTDMTFVISGEFDTLTRSDIEDIVKTYGGRVTSAVSGKTMYLLRGRDAGLSKLEKAKKLGTKILDEEGFYNLVESTKEAGQVSEEPAPSATVVEEPSKGRGKVKTVTSQKSAITSEPSTVSVKPSSSLPSSSSPSVRALPSRKAPTPGDELLWTEKYKPTKLSDIIGNKSQIERLSTWLAEWQMNRKKNFPEGKGLEQYRAVLISGPPGIGKTTAAQLLAKEHGYSALEFNASDTRNKKILEEMVTETMDNRSMTEFFAGDRSGIKSSKKPNLVDGKVVLVMDEVDGMSAGDRGGSAELARLIRVTKIPIICICNDSRADKVKPLLKVCYEAKFHRTPAKNMRARIMKIAYNEKLKIEANAVDELVSQTGNDIRQIINVLSTYRLSKEEMKYGDAKIIGSQNQKYSQISLFDIPFKLLGSYQWQQPNLNELSDVYFHDYSLSNLMMFENYTKASPSKSSKWNKSGNPKERECLEMDLIAKAANAIAEGDLVDHRIMSNQEFSLMPVHSIFSCVRPAYYMEGSLMGNRIGFPLWLGQNSKTMKNKRLLANIQSKMRAKATVDLSEVRQHYVPALTAAIFKGLANGDYDKAMDTMDYYYLDRENLETLSDLALTPKPVMSSLPAAAKRAFNKLYKQRTHPVLFELSDTTPLKSKAAAPKEDLEGVIFEIESENEGGSEEEQAE